jgi:HEAT repeat protein
VRFPSLTDADSSACETHSVQLPPEDQPDTIDIGPVKDIPIFHEDDPRLEEDRALWSAARRRAQALHSPDELLSGLRDHDWRVRHESVDRLVARGKDDPRTLPALIVAGLSDSVWQVRDAAVMRLKDFRTTDTIAALRQAQHDRHAEVRDSATYCLQQMDMTD